MASIFEAAPAELPLHLRPGSTSTTTTTSFGLPSTNTSTVNNTTSASDQQQKDMAAAAATIASRAIPRMFARIPPPNFSSATHKARCLTQLRSKNNGLEKYIFLNGLKERDPNLFYSLLYDNMRVSIC